MTGDVDSAADLAQDVFLKAFERLDSYRGDSKFSTWLYSIARNHCMDEMRSRAARPPEVSDAALEALPDTDWERASQTLERRESVQALRHLIEDPTQKSTSTVSGPRLD